MDLACRTKSLPDFNPLPWRALESIWRAISHLTHTDLRVLEHEALSQPAPRPMISSESESSAGRWRVCSCRARVFHLPKLAAKRMKQGTESMGRILAALAVALLLVPGNLLAGVLGSAAAVCEADGCGCPPPDPGDSAPAWRQDCCCEAQPAPEPLQPPAPPLKPAQEALGGDDAALAATPLDIVHISLARLSLRPMLPARTPPDPIFLRYRNLRL